MPRVYGALFLYLLSGVAIALDLSDLTHACRTSGTEHVLLFTDLEHSQGESVSSWRTRDAVDWVHNSRIVQTCSAEYLALAHCHFKDDSTPSFPSTWTHNGGDILSLVVHETLCAPARLIRNNKRAPIEHLVVVVETGEVTAYRLGPYFRSRIEESTRITWLNYIRNPLGSVLGRRSQRMRGYDPPPSIPPIVLDAVLKFEDLRDPYLEQVTKSRGTPSLREMLKGHETHFTAREWRLR